MSDFDNTSENRGDVFDLPQLRTDVDEEPGDFGHSMNFAPMPMRADEKVATVDKVQQEHNFDELPTSYQTFIHRSKYARYRDDLGRRETWSETVKRYIDFFDGHLKAKCGYTMTHEDCEDVRNAISNLSVMPSMRALMTAGPALARDNIAGYNCAFVAVDDQRAFDEILYVLMNGTGVGFSVERQYVTNLPYVPEFKTNGDKHIIYVGDSKEGWAFALQQLFAFLYNGIIPTWDLSNLRPAGARLMTFGGRSSGPKPLDELFKFVVSMFKNAQGRKLQSIEVHDIVCKIAEIVVVGGVRRCIPENALVFAQHGLIPIKNINIGDFVLTTSGYKKVTNKFEQGVQAISRIKTQDGFMDCTLNHRMAVFTSPTSYEWKEAKSLSDGDRMITNRVPIDGRSTSLPTWTFIKSKHSTTCKNITIPDLDADMAWFIGLFHADGYTYPAYSESGYGAYVNLVFGINEADIAERARAQILRFNNALSVPIKKRKGEESLMVYCKSKQLAWYLDQNIKQAKMPIIIPDCILQATNAVKLAYLSGVLDGDGSAMNRPVQLVATVYPEFARQLQILAYSCGIETRLNIATEVPPSRVGWQPIHQVNIITAHSIKSLSECPQLAKKLWVGLKPQRSNGFPSSFISGGEIRAKYGLSKAKQMVIDSYETEFGRTHLCPTKVTSVELDVYENKTWDIEVEDAHEFFVDGYLSHNSALISLGNLSDDRMRIAKSGEWWKDNAQRALANNSVAYTEKPEIGRFMKEWMSLYESKSGERGIFNREGCTSHIKKNCPNRNPNHAWFCNPCSEIILRNREFCNLSEVVVRSDDTPNSLKEKVRIATILGTWQSSLTDFQYISERWKKNCEEEHLLGVSLTGIMDNAFMSGTYDAAPRLQSEYDTSGAVCEPAAKKARREISDSNDPWVGHTLPTFLTELKNVAIETNRIWAKKLNIDVSAAITTVKPSGTVSQLVDSASGIHTRHAKYYIRTVRSDIKDPMTKFLQDSGVPWEPCAMKPNDTIVFSFPIKAPDVCITRDDQTALQQLEICKIYNEYWCQHKVSVTINVKESEWMRVGSWIWDNFDTTSGISFLPHSEHTYQQAPYQECDEATYLTMVSRMPRINWKKLRRYETTDMTSGVKELACTAGGCEL